MNKFFRFVGVLSVSSLFVGCPLLTDHPIAPSMNAPMNPRLTGTWTEVENPTDREPISISILAFNENEYYMEWRVKDDEELYVIRFRAFISTIDNVSFLNSKFLGCSHGIYEYINFDLSSDNVMTLRVIDEELFLNRPSTSEELFNSIQKYLNNEKLYNTPMKLIRANKSGECN